MMREKIKGILTDSVLSIVGLTLMNCVAQFFVYPIWSRSLGSEAYGNVLYYLSVMNIFAISVGSGCNYARMAKSAGGKTDNESYALILLGATPLFVPVCLAAVYLSGNTATPQELALYVLLSALTMWRFYADVEYRLSLSYRGFFFYYLIISVGYLAGSGLFLLTGLWPLALLPGEALGILQVLWHGKILRLSRDWNRRVFSPVFRLVMTMVVTNVLSNTIFNADRILLTYMLNGTAVTIFYLSSLLGKTVSLVTTPMNGVIVGYLARYKGKLTLRMMGMITAALLFLALLATGACVLASHILIPILYPQQYDMAKPYFWVSNLAQVLYFMTNVVTVVLLRFSKSNYQLYINALYAVAFFALCIPGILLGGFDGFCVALLLTNTVRMLYSLALGFKTALENEKEKK